MPRCAACDKQTPDGATLCMHCGAPLPPSDDTSTAVDMRESGQSGQITIKQTIYQFPSLPTSPRVIAPTGLPRAAAFVGRVEIQHELMARLRAGEHLDLFALGGIGGIGKTALAAEMVARLATDAQAFPGGAVWIACKGLAGAAGLAELWSRVARALRLEQITSLPNLEARGAALAKALAQRQRMLLALDHLEPGLKSEKALRALALPDTTVLLVTTREKLAAPQLQGLIGLPPLDTADAYALFVQRLRQTDQSRPTPIDELDLPRLLALTGGVPLIVELTAAYAGVQGISLEAVRQEIEADGLHSDTLQNALPQQAPRALRLCLARASQWLTPRQQRLFASLALLAGEGFPRRAALALAQAAPEEDDPPTEQAGPAKELAVLMAYALVEPLPGERLRLHPLLRAYAAERLAKMPEAQQERLGKVMLTYWWAYAEAHPGEEGVDALEAEAEGLLGALAWAHEHARHHTLLALADALGTAWDQRGQREDELRIYTWATQAARVLGKPVWQRWAAHQLAATRQELGQLVEALAGYEQALAMAKELGDLAAERVETHALAALYTQAGRRAEARAGYERALAITRQLSDLAAEREELHGLAVLNAQAGRPAEARRAYERALALAEQLGNLTAERVEVHELAVLDWQTRRFAEARAGYKRALAIARQSGDLDAEREELHGLAVLDAQAGRLAAARAGLERALTLARQLGDQGGEASELRSLGVLLGQHDEREQGHALINESLAICERLGDIQGMGDCHQSLGWLARAESNKIEAVTHFREALRCFEQVQSSAAEEVRAELHRSEVRLFPIYKGNDTWSH